MQRGFTLIELLIAFGIFVLIMGGTLGLVQIAIQVQEAMLYKQAALEETLFIQDYIARALRGAKKDLAGDCLTWIGGGSGGYTFEVRDSFGNWNYIRFIDRNDKCRELRVNHPAGDRIIYERISEDETEAGFSGMNAKGFYAITSNEFVVSNFNMREQGVYQGDVGNPDFTQPTVTFTISLGQPPTPYLLRLNDMETTVTTRSLDVIQ